MYFEEPDIYFHICTCSCPRTKIPPYREDDTMKPTAGNLRLSELINRYRSRKQRMVSLEVSAYKPVDFTAIDRVRPAFCSIISFGELMKHGPKQSKPFVTAQILMRKGYVVLLHIAGIYYNQKEMMEILRTCKKMGIRNILALKGDTPVYKTDEAIDFPYSTTLVQFINDKFRGYFDIAVVGFPCVHPASRCMEDEMLVLKDKVVSGANIIISQACLNPEEYLRFKNDCLRYSIDVPIIMGIFNMTSFFDIKRIKQMSKSVDPTIFEMAKTNRKDKMCMRNFGRNLTISIAKTLIKDDQVAGIHFFTMNNFYLTMGILRDAGILKEL